MEGRARAPAAGTVLNALATGTGAAFAIDEYVTATVSLDEASTGVTGHIADAPDADTTLVETAVTHTLDAIDVTAGGTVETTSAVPMASGLKSSSAAANATVLATLAATDATLPPEDAARIGVAAAREAGVTVTGAFDDAAASMLGGVVVTDNDADELLHHDTFETTVLVWTPPTRAYSVDAPVEKCRRVASVADHVRDLALASRYPTAMTVNGLAFTAALDYDPTPLLEALPHAAGATLSGTGPSVIAVGDRDSLRPVYDRWQDREGDTWLTTTQQTGATRT
ncbi:MAG: shikimate kinase [Halobacteriaceae archaeon]